jgi:hypothetical protein
VLLAVDTARRSGWATYARGHLVHFGEVDTLEGALLGVLVGKAVELGTEHAVPPVLVLEAPFGGSAEIVASLGGAAERWLVAWRAAQQANGRVVKVLPSQWRGPVLGRDAVRMPREQVRALEVQCASALVHQQCGHDEAAAILIGRWAAHAAEVGRVIGKRAVRASVEAWTRRPHGRP